jgi:hypothetical protein
VHCVGTLTAAAGAAAAGPPAGRVDTERETVTVTAASGGEPAHWQARAPDSRLRVSTSRVKRPAAAASSL